MFNFDILISLFDNLSVMLVAAAAAWGLIELVKYILDKKGVREGWKDLLAPVLYILSFLVYLALALVRRCTNPIITALLNALLLVALESSIFSIIKGVGKLINFTAAWVKNRVGK